MDFLQVDANTSTALFDFVSVMEPHFSGVLDTLLCTGKRKRGRFDQECLASAHAIGQAHCRIGMDLMGVSLP
ncbi:Methyl-accepting chemotaxis protein [Candidatus Terasakiella magnetica]|nr:Methyl-accepting chemotaxis protein [Candidatus Terasakiella magnetica]